MDARHLTITTARDGRICVVAVHGELDISAVAEFGEQVARAVDAQTERFVLDLAGLTFLDCAGARALAAVKHAVPGGCPVIVRAVSPAARQALDLLDLDPGHQGTGRALPA